MSTSSYRPEDYTSVAPYLIVDGAARTIDLLVNDASGTTW
jgi:hypothetical protein